MKGDAINGEVEAQFLAKLEQALPQHDVVIVADYGHGLMTEKAVKLVCEKAKFLAVNTQTNALAAFYGSPLSWVIMLAPLGFVLALSFGIQKMSVVAAQATFWAFPGDVLALIILGLAGTKELILESDFRPEIQEVLLRRLSA